MNKSLIKYRKRFLLSASNVSRSIFLSAFGLITNYVLLQYKAEHLLTDYVYCISIVNLFLVASNWGGKDFNMKVFTQDPAAVPKLLSKVFNSKGVILSLLVVIIWLTSLEIQFKLFVSGYLILRCINTIFDSLVILQKKFHHFLFYDFIINSLFVCLVLFDQNFTSTSVLLLEIIFLELIRLCVNMISFKNLLYFKFNVSEGLQLIKQSAPFFYISLAGFICSKADIYVVGLAINKEQMAMYFIILNLVSLAHITWAAFQSTYSSNIFRYNLKSFRKFSIYSALTGLLFSFACSIVIYAVCTFYYQIQLTLIFILTIFINIFSFTLLLTEMYRCTRLGMQSVALYILIISGVINIGVSFLLVSQIGILGALAGNTLGGLFTLSWLAFYLKKRGEKNTSAPEILSEEAM